MNSFQLHVVNDPEEAEFRVLDIRMYDSMAELISEYDNWPDLPTLIIVKNTSQETQLLNRIKPNDDILSLKKELKTQLEIRFLRLIKRYRSNRDLINQDALTGLINRREGHRILDRMAKLSRPENPLSLVMLDLDHFKAVNDRYGHEAGDLILIEIGEILQSVKDLSGYAFRYGGEEFLLAFYSDYNRAITYADYLRKEIKSQKFLDEKITVTVSFGVATTSETQNIQDLIKQADEAMYVAKYKGRNKVIGYYDLMESSANSDEDPDVREFEVRARVLSERMTNYLTLRTKRMTTKLKQKADHDGLTGLYNRMYFDRRISREFDTAQSKDRSLSLLFLDIDHFGKVNKSYGFPTGDKALTTVASVLNDSIRTVDWIARYGGEEFCVIMPDSDLSAAIEVGERIRTGLKEISIEAFDQRQFFLTASLGAGEINADESLLDFIQRVSDKTRQAKESGRDQLCH